MAFSRLAEYDPEGAATWAGKLGELRFPAQEGALMSWARLAPQAAYRYLAESLSGVTDPLERESSSRLLASMMGATGEARLAVESMERIADSELAATMVHQGLKHWSEIDPDAAFQWAQTAEDYGIRNGYTRELLHGLAPKNPEKAFSLAMTIDQPRLREESVRWTLMQWGGQGAPEALEAYLNLPDMLRTENLTHNVAPFLLRNGTSAFDIAEQLPPGVHRNFFDYLGVTRMASETPLEAAKSALDLADEGHRARALRHVGREWLKADPSTARTWLVQEGGLSGEAVNELQSGN